jgi:hypothetical protein
MNAQSRRYELDMPKLSAKAVRLYAEKTQDLVLSITTDGYIAGALQTTVFSPIDINFWIGQHLTSIASSDSKVKIPMLLDNDASITTSNAIWRHINLIGLNGNNIPVRAIYMTLENSNQIVHCLFCRDLSSAQEVNDRFIAAQQELLNKNYLLQSELDEKIRQLNNLSSPVDFLVNSIKQFSYEKIINDTVNNLERECMRTLLLEAGGDHERAAGIAKCNLKDWLTKAALLKL